MKRFFSLATYLLKRLSITKKLMLVGLLLLFPLFVLTYFHFQNIQNDIDATKRSKLGLEYSIELRKLLEHLPKYRGLSYAVSHGEENLSELAEQQSLAVKKAFRQVDDVNLHIGRHLQLSEHWTNIKAKWKAIYSETSIDSLSAKDQFDQYTQLINELISLIILTGDNSGLILDSKIESYYLMTMVTRELPAMINSVQTLRGLSSNRALTQEISTDNSYLPTLLGVLREHQKQLILIHVKVLQENPHIRDEMDKLLEEVQSKLSLYINTLQNSKYVYSVTENFELGTAAIQSIFKFYDFAVVSLDDIYSKQIIDLSSTKRLLLGGIFLSLLLSLYLYIGFYLSIISNIRSIVEATQNIAKGHTQYRIKTDSHDELRIVAKGFNRMAITLERNKNEIEQAQETLETMSKLDAVTNLPNRRFLEEVLDSEWRRAMRSNSILTIMMLDIDFFKKFNDTYGHLAGDECLKKVGLGLNSITNRGADFVARYGGEEFIIVAPDTTSDGANKFAEKILARIEGLCIPHSGNEASEYVTVSIGIATTHPKKDTQTYKDLIQHADNALYKAKENGRNQYAIADETGELKLIEMNSDMESTHKHKN